MNNEALSSTISAADLASVVGAGAGNREELGPPKLPAESMTVNDLLKRAQQRCDGQWLGSTACTESKALKEAVSDLNFSFRLDEVGAAMRAFDAKHGL